MENSQFHEDLQYVKSMIENNRRQLIDNGVNYITNAAFVTVGVIASYFLGINGHEDFLPYLWVPLVLLLISANLFFKKKVEKKNIKKTFIAKIFNAMWLACGIPIFIITMLHFVTGLIALPAMFIAVSAIMGIGYYLTGVINDLKFMEYLAFGWWAGTVLSLLWVYIGEEYQLGLFFSALVVVQQIIPGVIIYGKWRKANNV